MKALGTIYVDGGEWEEDEEDGVDVALDSSGNELHFRYLEPKSNEISTENPKFGNNSLKIINSKRVGILQLLHDNLYERLVQEITKMSVVVWVYIPAEIEDSIPAMSQDGENCIKCIALPEGAFVDDLGYFGDTALSADEINRIMQNGLQPFVENR